MGVLLCMAGRFVGPFLLALPLLYSGCNRSLSSAGRDSRDQYFLVAVNTQIPYWQTAASGFTRAASEMQVQGTVTGPGSYDPKAEQQEFRRIAQLKPAGILVSPADPDLMQSDIHAATG